MAAMAKRWYRSKRNLIITCVVAVLCILYYISLNNTLQNEPELDITKSLEVEHVSRLGRHSPRVLARHPVSVLEPADLKDRSEIIRYIERKIEETLKVDKGTGCEIPQLDPFAKEVTVFDKVLPKIVCSGKDWVKCYHSKCRVIPEILSSHENIICTYKDILYESDAKYTISPPTKIRGSNAYVLIESDHVKVSCTGRQRKDNRTAAWSGHTLGFRTTAKPKPPPKGRENTLNVMIFGFDSTARNGFIRRLPKSWKVLTEELGATVLKAYNILGDGTPAALFPLLTGKNELDLPDVRKVKNRGTFDVKEFIFHKLKEDGYRTAYFEDMPWIGTFQYRFNGFKEQPADHYLRAFYLEESNNGRKWSKPSQRYCVGDTPEYKLMMNITQQFLQLEGKRFVFTFIADITHDDFNVVATADDDTAEYLRWLKSSGKTEDTLMIIMGDHGPRYANVRDTLQGKLEERLPLMGVVLPAALRRARPAAQAALEHNARVLTTAHDVHATLLDALGLHAYRNDYRVRGADLKRGLSLLEPIPSNRSCSEAGIEPHWCACLTWEDVAKTDKLYTRTAQALVDFINALTEQKRSVCIPRTLLTIEWVMRQRANKGLLAFSKNKDADGYVGNFDGSTAVENENYQIKISVGPGRGVYEASLTYSIKEDKFHINTRDISRTNPYNKEPACVSATHPHLDMYCYCK